MNKTIELDHMPGSVGRNRRLLLIVFIPVMCAIIYPLVGYFNTTRSIAYYSKQNGVYPTLDEAFIALKTKYDDDFTDISDYVVQKKVDRPSYPFIWYMTNIKKSRLRDGDLTNNTWGGSYFIHTKDGWIHHPETLSLAIGDMGYWMEIYNLYGDELE